MKAAKALAIIRCLADGVDPNTGEAFASDAPYQHPDIIRALFAAAQAMERDGHRTKPLQSPPKNSGKPWDKEEDKHLLDRIEQGASIGELAQDHGRTCAAIQTRLEKLGKTVLAEQDKITQPLPSDTHPELTYVFSNGPEKDSKQGSGPEIGSGTLAEWKTLFLPALAAPATTSNGQASPEAASNASPAALAAAPSALTHNTPDQTGASGPDPGAAGAQARAGRFGGLGRKRTLQVAHPAGH